MTYLGETGHALQGRDALAAFEAAMGPDAPFLTLHEDALPGGGGYRIDRHRPEEARA